MGLYILFRIKCYYWFCLRARQLHRICPKWFSLCVCVTLGFRSQGVSPCLFKFKKFLRALFCSSSSSCGVLIRVYWGCCYEGGHLRRTWDEGKHVKSLDIASKGKVRITALFLRGLCTVSLRERDVLAMHETKFNSRSFLISKKVSSFFYE